MGESGVNQRGPGVPWTRAAGDRDRDGSKNLVIALKSGNFGAPNFFIKAWGLLR